MRIYINIFILIFLTFASCKEGVDIEHNSVKFEFRLLNKNGEQPKVFKEGGNIVFSFLIINEGNRDLFFQQESFNTTEFLKVYEISSKGNINAVGKPYESMFCTFQNGILIPAKDTLKLEIPWIPDTAKEYYPFCLLEDNDYLTPGTYKIEFSSAFTFVEGENSFTTAKENFSIEFKIEQ